MAGSCRYFTHIVERSDPELLVLETDRCLFDDPAFKCALSGHVRRYQTMPCVLLPSQHVCLRHGRSPDSCQHVSP